MTSLINTCHLLTIDKLTFPEQPSTLIAEPSNQLIIELVHTLTKSSFVTVWTLFKLTDSYRTVRRRSPIQLSFLCSLFTMQIHPPLRQCASLGSCLPTVPYARHSATRICVFAPVKDESARQSASIDPRDKGISVSISDVRRPVAEDMDVMVKNLKNVVGDRHPMLMAAAEQIFGAGGKRLRPMLVFLVARATSKFMQQRCAWESSDVLGVIIGRPHLVFWHFIYLQWYNRKAPKTSWNHWDDSHSIVSPRWCPGRLWHQKRCAPVDPRCLKLHPAWKLHPDTSCVLLMLFPSDLCILHLFAHSIFKVSPVSYT